MTVRLGIGVVVAARKAAATIGRAIASALAEPKVEEVIVVVDGPADDVTVMAARVADDGTGRLMVEALDRNRGPSAARNRAIALGRAPLIAILDADDFLLPGRFARLLALPEWDMAADNIAFIPQSRTAAFDAALIPKLAPRARALDLAGFVSANLDRPRRELGYLKPVFRRAFLDAHGLRYDDRLRLGEDYALYCRALAAGARFTLIESCGYVATEGPDTLSRRHDTEDLAALIRSDDALLAQPGLTSAEHRAIARHRRMTARKHLHRLVLDRRREAGLIPGIFPLLARPMDAVSVALAILRDRPIAPDRFPPETQMAAQPRFLIESRYEAAR